MAETGAEWARTPPHDDSSDTDSAAETSVFEAVASSEPNPSAGATPEPDTTKASAGAMAEAAGAAKGSRVRIWVEEHPLAAAAIAVGAIGVGVVGYRWVRHSLPVRLYLALRFGRFRAVIRP